MRIMDSFRKRKVDILVATDLAARGLDVASIRTVVSYDVARDVQTHTHRVGRTGRAGEAGEAFTLLTSDLKNRKMAAGLVEHLEVIGSTAGEDLMDLAMKHVPFRASRLAVTQKRGGPGSAPNSVNGSAAAEEQPRKRARSASPPSPPSPPPTP